MTVIFTIGHSTHPIEEFIRMLQAFDIDVIADVRTVAGSRHNPQFNAEELARSLAERNIGYQRLEALGGLRHTTKASVNGAWKNASFRGYADYMQTEAFTDGVEQLVELAQAQTVAIMCAEAVPWRCHRSLIGDALIVRGVGVTDIMTEKSGKPHELTRFARVDGTRVSYPVEALPEPPPAA